MSIVVINLCHILSTYTTNRQANSRLVANVSLADSTELS